ncbi:MAG: hypothetical protein WCP58_01810 [bacterium]
MENPLRKRKSPLRSIFCVALTILAILVTTLGATSLWAGSTLFRTDRFMSVVSPVARDPQVIAVAGDVISRQIDDALRLQQRLAGLLPDDLDFLAAPASNLVRGYIQDLLQEILASETVSNLTIEAIRLAHQAAMAVLRGDVQGTVSITDGQVVLNLFQPVVFALRELQKAGLLAGSIQLPPPGQVVDPEQARQALQSALGVSLEPGFGAISLFRSELIVQAQQAYSLFNQLNVALLAVAALLLVGAFLLARRRWLVGIIFGAALASCMGILYGLATSQVNGIIASLPGQNGRQILQAALTPVVADFLVFIWWMVAAGLAVALLSGILGWLGLRRAVARPLVENSAKP